MFGMTVFALNSSQYSYLINTRFNIYLSIVCFAPAHRGQLVHNKNNWFSFPIKQLNHPDETINYPINTNPSLLTPKPSVSVTISPFHGYPPHLNFPFRWPPFPGRWPLPTRHLDFHVRMFEQLCGPPRNQNTTATYVRRDTHTEAHGYVNIRQTIL